MASSTAAFNDTHPAQTNGATRQQLRQLIRDTLAETPLGDELADDADLFKLGLDSLQVSSLLTTIHAFIGRSQQPVDLIRQEAIYKNPSISKLVNLVTK